jgi:3-hydroxybutyryl-CoA dehydrogenase
MEIKKVGVVGCGIMGSGIAQVCAQYGYETVVSEINNELLNKGLGMIKDSLAKSVAKGKLTKENEEATLARLKGTTNIEDFAGCALVIEAATENPEIKKQMFADLDRICPPEAILASNTSSISISELATATKRPDKVCGIHFMNPVPVMRGVELVKSILTSEETINTAKSFAESIGKETWISKDAPGFISNRLLVPYLLDAIRLLESGFATKEDIDKCTTLSFNYPMGPLRLSDMIGLDTIYFIANVLYEGFKDPKCAPPNLLKQMVAANWLGRKTNKGFYEY